MVVGIRPTPHLAPLLWDASALITTGGGPAAHLFESARAINIPAVCAIHLDQALGTSLRRANHHKSLAVDGEIGWVAITDW